jgi:hypothetical protein
MRFLILGDEGGRGRPRELRILGFELVEETRMEDLTSSETVWNFSRTESATWSVSRS